MHERRGLPSFGADDDLPPVPSAEIVRRANEGNAALGFVSEKGTHARPAAAARQATYTANFHIRVRPEDRQRFDDFAYSLRMGKGEAFAELLDQVEELHRSKAGQNG